MNSSYVKLAFGILASSNVKVCSVVGFPLGAMSTDAKKAEAAYAYHNGADEIDMVVNIGRLKSGDEEYVRGDIRALALPANGFCPLILKVILETALLIPEEVVRGCKIAVDAGAHFVKTSTGFAVRGASLDDIRLMRATVGPNIGVKASGGIKDYAAAKAMIDAGATRIGTSSGVAIVMEELALLGQP